MVKPWAQNLRQNLPACSKADDLAEAWAMYCRNIPWSWFATLTFDPARRGWGEENQERTLVQWLTRIDEGCREQQQRGTPLPPIIGRVYAAGSSELTCAGMRHYHLLVGGVGSLRRLLYMDVWNYMAGYARIYPFDATRAEMNRYCFKYCCKGGHHAESWWYRLEIPGMKVLLPKVT